MSKDVVKEWERPSFREQYTGEKEDQAFKDLEAKLKKEEVLKNMDKAATSRPNVPHYLQGQIEPIDFITSHDMNFNLGNAVKYITRCNHKGTKQEDLKKAIDYLNFELERNND